MSTITFANKSTMQVDKVYEIKPSDPNNVVIKNTTLDVSNAISSSWNNADYVIFSKTDKLFLATGKGEGAVKNYDKKLDTAVSGLIKFDDVDVQAEKVINKINTPSEFDNAYAKPCLNPLTLVGIPALVGVAGGILMGSTAGKIIAGVYSVAIAATYFGIKNEHIKVNQPDIDNLVRENTLVETKIK